MRNNANTETIIGRIYSKNLSERTVANKNSANFGKTFINGTIDVATDEAGLNVLQVHYSYVTPETKAGKPNVSYNNLKKILDSGKTILTDGKDLAWKVRLTPAAALNDFYPQGQEEVVSTPRNEGGFVTIISGDLPKEDARNQFTFDTLITGVTHVEADEEKGIAEDYCKIKCAIFNFRNDLLPFTLIAKHPDAMNYFEGLDASASNPVYTKVWGHIVSKTIAVEHKVESAFGSDAVDVSERRVREWVITGAVATPYDFGDPAVMTAEEVKNAIANRNVYLADVKKKSDEYYASKNNAIPQASEAQIPAGGFSF